MSLSRILMYRQIFIANKNNLLRRYSSTQNDFNLADVAVQAYLKKMIFEHEHLYTKIERTPEESKRYFEIKPIVNVLQHRITLYENIESLRELIKRQTKNDEDMKNMIKEEAQIYLKRMTEVDRELQSILLEPQLTDGAVLVELSAGEGGHEAMLFARELYEMYERYARYKDWDVCIVSLVKSDIGGIKKALMFVEGVGAPELMKMEAGVHRVQKIPASEKDSHIKTSTVSVTVIPKPTGTEANIPDCDMVIELKRTNDETTSSNAVRILHTPTGIVIKCDKSPSKRKNKEIAVQALRTLLLDRQQREKTSKTEIKSQIGATEKYETIRTYNFSQDQVMEHREGGGTVHKLQAFMEGDYKLEQMQQNLLREHKRRAFLEEISQFAKTINVKSSDDKYK